MNYYTYMNRNQIKSALINCAKTHGISLSELASEAGISPSTITGFVNDAKTRADHVLSMRTIGKLTKKFPDLATFLQIAQPLENLREVRFLGLINPEQNWQITALSPDTPGSTMIKDNGQEYVAFGMNSSKIMNQNRAYFCKPKMITDDEEIIKNIGKLVVAECTTNCRHLGYLTTTANNKFELVMLPGTNIAEPKLHDIKWIMIVDWIRP